MADRSPTVRAAAFQGQFRTVRLWVRPSGASKAWVGLRGKVRIGLRAKGRPSVGQRLRRGGNGQASTSPGATREDVTRSGRRRGEQRRRLFVGYQRSAERHRGRSNCSFRRRPLELVERSTFGRRSLDGRAAAFDRRAIRRERPGPASGVMARSALEASKSPGGATRALCSPASSCPSNSKVASTWPTVGYPRGARRLAGAHSLWVRAS